MSQKSSKDGPSYPSTNASSKSPTDKNKYDQFNLSKKMKVENIDELYQAKSYRGDKGSITEDPKTNEKYNELTKSLKEFYNEFKSYVMNEVSYTNLGKEFFQEVKEKITTLRGEKEDDPFVMLKYSNQLLKTLANSKKEEESFRSKSVDGDFLNDYELLLQKAENDIRQHIRTNFKIEQQLKLLIETMQQKLEEYEKNKDNLSHNTKTLLKEAQNDNARLIEMIKQKEQEIDGMNKILKQKNEAIKSYEERILTITILEHKLKSLKDKHQKEKDDTKKFYEQEFSNLTKEIQHIHKVLSVNLGNEEKIKLLQKELISYKDFNIKKVQHLENRLRQLDELKEKGHEGEESAEIAIYTEPDMSDRRRSLRPSTSSSSIVKYKAYDLNSQRHSTEMINSKKPENKPTNYKQYLNQKKNDLVNELNILSITRVKDAQQKQQKNDIARKTTREFDNYFKYFSNRLDSLQQATEKEKDQLKSFESRRSSSVKRQSHSGGSYNAGLKKDRSFDKMSKEKSNEEVYLKTERLSHNPNVPKPKPSPGLSKAISQSKLRKY